MANQFYLLFIQYLPGLLISGNYQVTGVPPVVSVSDKLYTLTLQPAEKDAKALQRRNTYTHQTKQVAFVLPFKAQNNCSLYNRLPTTYQSNYTLRDFQGMTVVASG